MHTSVNFLNVIYYQIMTYQCFYNNLNLTWGSWKGAKIDWPLYLLSSLLKIMHCHWSIILSICNTACLATKMYSEQIFFGMFDEKFHTSQIYFGMFTGTFMKYGFILVSRQYGREETSVFVAHQSKLSILWIEEMTSGNSL